MHIYSNTFLGTYKYSREKFYDYSHLKSIFHPYREDVTGRDHTNKKDKNDSRPPLSSCSDRGFPILWTFFSGGSHEIFEVLRDGHCGITGLQRRIWKQRKARNRRLNIPSSHRLYQFPSRLPGGRPRQLQQLRGQTVQGCQDEKDVWVSGGV